MFGTHSGSLVSEVTDPFLRPDCQLDLDHPAGLLQEGEKHEFWIRAIPHATKRGQPNTAIETFQDTEQLDATQEETYPQGTFEALLVITVDWCENLQELQDALLVI